MRASTLLLGILIGCGGQAAPEPAPAPAPPPAAEAPAPAEHEHPAPSAEAPMMAMPAVPEGARVFFVAPTEGQKVVGPLVEGKVVVEVEMGAEKIAVVPAGEMAAGSGHHHVLVDTEPVAAGQVVPKDDQHLHFGKAQTKASIPLAPGPHVLQLQFADGIHRSYGATLFAKLSLTVAAAGSVEATAEPKAEPKVEAKPAAEKAKAKATH